MKGSFLLLSCLMLLLGLCTPTSAEESGSYTVMCQNLRAPSSKEFRNKQKTDGASMQEG